MNDSSNSVTNRREFIKTTGRIAAVSALAGVSLPHAHAAVGETIQVGLVGCGGRGSGAADQALSSSHGQTKLVAMADVFQDRLDGSYNSLKGHGAKVDVPQDRKFIGFDGYKKVMDCLKPGDIVILTTPPAFRWVHFGYAIQKGLNVFMEKPVTVDGPTSKRMLQLADAADKKNLKVGVGLMSRHSRAMQELHQRIHNGEVGEILFMRGYRMHGPAAACFMTKYPGGEPSELLWQIRNFHSFLWASGGLFSDFYIHHVDQLCWMKNAVPIKAQALGGRHYKTDADGNPYVDQNFDTYSVEYTFADGSKMYLDGRCENGCNDIYSSYAHGTKGLAVVANHGDCEKPSRIFKGQNMQASNMLWKSTDNTNPYQNEWDDLLDAIKNNKPYNEARYGIAASLVSSMGRMAAHTGQEITYEAMLNCEHEFAPGVDKLRLNSPAPLKAGPDGKYPQPMPGITKDREF
jgi:predicted dehydrogenase